MTQPYDRSDQWSILEYSKRLLGKTLEEAIAPTQIEELRGKGKLGQLIEKYFFGYELNSNQEADFSEAGLELKCTPLKELTTKVLAIKERLVLTMIDYSKAHQVPFEESHVYTKCMYMLILFYLHKAGIPVQQLHFIYCVLWQIPEKDLLIMKQEKLRQERLTNFLRATPPIWVLAVKDRKEMLMYSIPCQMVKHQKSLHQSAHSH